LHENCAKTFSTDGFFQAYAFLASAFLFGALKCVRKRLVLGLALADCLGAVLFELAAGLTVLTAGVPNWTNWTLWLTASS